MSRSFLYLCHFPLGALIVDVDYDTPVFIREAKIVIAVVPELAEVEWMPCSFGRFLLPENGKSRIIELAMQCHVPGEYHPHMNDGII